VIKSEKVLPKRVEKVRNWITTKMSDYKDQVGLLARINLFCMTLCRNICMAPFILIKIHNAIETPSIKSGVYNAPKDVRFNDFFNIGPGYLSLSKTQVTPPACESLVVDNQHLS